ncbi:hypothetical protein BDY19DRAFT_900462, partial [Irpex rosettiformis]
GELEHRHVKRFYSRTNKWHFTRQITKQQRREELLRRVKAQACKQLNRDALPSSSATSGPHKQRKLGTRSQREENAISLSFDAQDPLASAPPSLHHQISENNRHLINLASWLAEHEEDRAVKDFVPRLKNHILARLSGQDYHDDITFSNSERRSVTFVNNRIY